MSGDTIVNAPGAIDTDGFTIFGWSQGYLAFAAGSNAADQPFIVTSHSADGIRWRAGDSLRLTGAPELGRLHVTKMIEGPAGLLALGSYGSDCGPTNYGAMWLSSDGIVWRLIEMANAFGPGFIHTINAGSGGYIATGYAGNTVVTAAVWTSPDGLVWTKVNLQDQTFEGLQVNDATAFALGYVLAGVIPDGPGVACGGQPSLTPALWWSSDGHSWTRDQIPGTTEGTDTSMSVSRINDHALFAYEWNTPTSSWTSTDGRTWNPAAALPGWLITNGQRGLTITEPYQSGQIEVSAFNNDLSLSKLTETGEVPDYRVWADGNVWPMIAFGPTGLIIANVEGSIWAGVPVAA